MMIGALLFVLFIALARACFRLGRRRGFEAGLNAAARLWPQRGDRGSSR